MKFVPKLHTFAIFVIMQIVVSFNLSVCTHKATEIQQQTSVDDTKHHENVEEEETAVESVHSVGIIQGGLQGLHCLQGGPDGNQEEDWEG